MKKGTKILPQPRIVFIVYTNDWSLELNKNDTKEWLL